MTTVATRELQSQLPMAGVRVLDFGQYVAGPAGARILAELGADVIKCERYGRDPVRAMGLIHTMANKGKRGVGVDLKTPEGLEITRALVRTADVVMHNWRPGVAERLGLDRGEVSRLNPTAIYAICPGFGSSGPYSKLGALEPLVSTRAGIMRYSERTGEEPRGRQGANMDWGNSLFIAAAVLLAIRRRLRTGRGLCIEAPEYAAAMFSLGEVYLDADDEVRGQFQLDPDHLGMGDPAERIYPTADGWLTVACYTKSQWDSLCAALGLAMNDSLAWSARCDARNAEVVVATISAALKRKPAAEWSESLREVGAPCEVVTSNFIEEALDSPGLLETGRIAELEDPDLGRIVGLGDLFRLGPEGAERVPMRPPPRYGEHNEEILLELGYGQDVIDDYTSRGIIQSDQDSVGIRH